VTARDGNGNGVRKADLRVAANCRILPLFHYQMVRYRHCFVLIFFVCLTSSPRSSRSPILCELHPSGTSNPPTPHVVIEISSRVLNRCPALRLTASESITESLLNGLLALLSLVRSPKRQTLSDRALPAHSVPSNDLAVRAPSSVVSVVAVDIDSVSPSQRITLP